MAVPTLYWKARLLALGGVFGLLLLTAAMSQNAMADNGGGIWDDTLTRAKSGVWDYKVSKEKSGVEGELFDPGDSTGKAGLKPPHQWFFQPPQRFYESVDPDELDDYKKKDYAPYALAQFAQSVTYRGQSIPKGYYLVMLGGVNDGSQKSNLKTLPPMASNSPPGGSFYEDGLPQHAPPDPGEDIAPPPVPANKQPKEKYARQTFVIKKLGNVVAVLPIERSERYKRKKGEKKLKNPVATIVMENHLPVLKVYWKDTVYSTVLSGP